MRQNIIFLILLTLSVFGGCNFQEKSVVSEFKNKYDFFYHKELFQNELYKDDTIVAQNAPNVKFYGNNGGFASDKGEGDAHDFVCNGKQYKKSVNKFYDENIWCIKYKGKEFVSNSSGFFVNDNFIIYTKCEESEYYNVGDANKCTKVNLYLNDQVIDSIKTEDKKDSAWFENFQISDRTVLYETPDGYFTYNLDTKEKIEIESEVNEFKESELTKDAEGNYYYDIFRRRHFVDLNSKKTIKKAMISNEKIAYKIEREDSSNYKDFEFNPYDLFFNGKIYEKIQDFILLGDNIYYYRVFLIKKEGINNIYKVSLIKNDKKLDDFYIELGNSYSYHNDFPESDFISTVPPNCLPKTSICIYDSQTYLLSGINYENPDFRNIGNETVKTYPSLFKTNFTSISGIYLEGGEPGPYTPIINMSAHLVGKDYLIIGNYMGTQYYLLDLKKKESKPILLYTGTYPIFIRAKE